MLLSLFLYSSFSLMIFAEQIACSNTNMIAVPGAESIGGKVQLIKRYYDNEKNTLYAFIVSKNKPLVALALSQATESDLQFRNVRQETLAHSAVSCKHNGILKIVLTKMKGSLDIDAQAYDGQTAVHYAVFSGNKNGLKLLKKYGASLDIKDNDGITPLSLAVRLGKDEIAYQLLQSGAQVDAKNIYGHEPLHFAKTAIMVKNLIKKGGNPNAQGYYGHPPIVFAVQKNRHAVVQALYAAGARVDYCDERNNNLATFAKPLSPVKELLINAGVIDVVTNHQLRNLRFFKKEITSIDIASSKKDNPPCIIS